MPHLLLVDDDDLFRESLGLNLIDEGYEVTSFANGRDVLAYLDQGGGADVMLLDWRMPNLTGLDVLRQIRAAGTSIPVIFLTVLSDDIYEEAALESGAVDFIDEHHVGKQRSGAKHEVAGRLIEHVHADDVARHEISGSLDALELPAKHPCEGLGEQCLAEPWYALHQHVPAGKQRDYQRVHGRLSTDDDAAELLRQNLLKLLYRGAHAASCLSVLTIRLCRRVSGTRRSEYASAYHSLSCVMSPRVTRG